MFLFHVKHTAVCEPVCVFLGGRGCLKPEPEGPRESLTAEQMEVRAEGYSNQANSIQTTG